MIDWIENHGCEKITIQLLIDKMSDYFIVVKSLNPRICIKIVNDKVSFHEVSGTETIVILQRKAEKIIDNIYKDLRRETMREEKLRIIQTVPQLTKEGN